MSRKDDLLDAAMTHALFDGWSQKTIEAACADTGISRTEARRLLPRGPVDLALAYHQRGDARMEEILRGEDLSDMRYSARVAHAVRVRLELADKELVRRGFSLFALPQNAALGSRALWQTADRIWRALGDTSRDINWYTKRATLSAVYSSTALFWIGDDSEGDRETWAFLDRRIANVMQFEKAKARARENPLVGPLLSAPGKLFGRVRAPASAPRHGAPR